MSATAAAVAAFDGHRRCNDEQFETMMAGLRAELAPTTVMEALLVEQIVLAVGRLRSAAQMETPGKIDRDWLRFQTLAERSFWKALQTLEKGRRQAAREARAAESAATTVEPKVETRPSPAPAARPAEPRPAAPPTPKRSPLAELLATVVEPTGLVDLPDLAATPTRSRMLAAAS